MELFHNNKGSIISLNSDKYHNGISHVRVRLQHNQQGDVVLGDGKAIRSDKNQGGSAVYDMPFFQSC